MRPFNSLTLTSLITLAALAACGGGESSDNASKASEQSASGEVAQNDSSSDDSSEGTSDGQDESAGPNSSDADSAPASPTGDSGGINDDPNAEGPTETADEQANEEDPSDGTPVDEPAPSGDEASTDGPLDPGDEDPVEAVPDPIGQDPGGEPTESLTPAECEEAGGTVVGDIGDGSIHRPGYVCADSGEPPIASIRPEDDGPIFIEGAVCCGGKADSGGGDVSCEEIACLRAVECVSECGGKVVQSGCCPCPEGTFDSIECNSNDMSGGTSGSCSSNADCGADEYCKTPAGSCDAAGECAIKPDACLDVFEPVCGCNNNDYSNACYAEMDGVSIGGECKQ